MIKKFLIYSFAFTLLMTPFFGFFSLKCISGGLIIGFFAGILNDILDELRK
jgi:hypothetical protein